MPKTIYKKHRRLKFVKYMLLVIAAILILLTYIIYLQYTITINPVIAYKPSKASILEDIKFEVSKTEFSGVHQNQTPYHLTLDNFQGGDGYYNFQKLAGNLTYDNKPITFKALFGKMYSSEQILKLNQQVTVDYYDLQMSTGKLYIDLVDKNIIHSRAVNIEGSGLTITAPNLLTKEHGTVLILQGGVKFKLEPTNQ